jgi:hypothetical protein
MAFAVKTRYAYYAVRRQNRYLGPTLGGLSKRFPLMKIIFLHMRIPNGVRLFNKLKTLKNITWDGNNCNLRAISELQLVEKLEEICKECTNYCKTP